MREVILKEGEYIRIKGKVTMYSPYKKVNGVWSGGSSSTMKNPLIRLGKCKHKPKRINFFKTIFGNRIKCKGRIHCSDCGYIIKLEKDFAKLNKDVQK